MCYPHDFYTPMYVSLPMDVEELVEYGLEDQTFQASGFIILMPKCQHFLNMGYLHTFKENESVFLRVYNWERTTYRYV